MTHLIINHYGTTLLNAYYIILDTKELKDIIKDIKISSLQAKYSYNDDYYYDSTWIIFILSKKPIKKCLSGGVLKTALINGYIYTSNRNSHFSVRNNVILFTLNYAKSYMSPNLVKKLEDKIKIMGS